MLVMTRRSLDTRSGGAYERAGLGARLRRARKDARLTLEEAAEALGVVRQSVFHWESGRNYPMGDRLKAVADLYGVSIDWLLGRAPDHLLAEAQAEYLTDEPPPTAEELRMAMEFIKFLRSQKPMRFEQTDEER